MSYDTPAIQNALERTIQSQERRMFATMPVSSTSSMAIQAEDFLCRRPSIPGIKSFSRSKDRYLNREKETTHSRASHGDLDAMKLECTCGPRIKKFPSFWRQHITPFNTFQDFIGQFLIGYSEG